MLLFQLWWAGPLFLEAEEAWEEDSEAAAWEEDSQAAAVEWEEDLEAAAAWEEEWEEAASAEEAAALEEAAAGWGEECTLGASPLETESCAALAGDHPPCGDASPPPRSNLRE